MRYPISHLAAQLVLESLTDRPQAEWNDDVDSALGEDGEEDDDEYVQDRKSVV